jgi:uncharacterized protein YndB with AHSA1/START domain
VIRKIVVTVLVLVAALLAFAATKPDTFSVQRSARIKAPPEKVFALINDFHNWGSWSPYEKLDPAMKRTLGGAPSGKGAIYEWDGNGKVGAGRMEITESSPASKVAMKLDFTKPMEGNNIAEFTLRPEGDATHVTWAMHGPAPFISKVAQVFCDLDAMIGKEFEAGLGNLKALTEK